MAARKNKPFHDDKTREKIQSSQLVNRLLKHIDTHPKKDNYEKDFMQKSQVTAALGLLKKTTPDLSAIEQTIDPESVDALKELMKLVGNTSRGIPTDS